MNIFLQAAYEVAGLLVPPPTLSNRRTGTRFPCLMTDAAQPDEQRNSNVEKLVRISITLPTDLLRKIETEVRRRDTDRSKFTRSALRHKLALCL